MRNQSRNHWFVGTWKETQTFHRSGRPLSITSAPRHCKTLTSHQSPSNRFCRWLQIDGQRVTLTSSWKHIFSHRTSNLVHQSVVVKSQWGLPSDSSLSCGSWRARFLLVSALSVVPLFDDCYHNMAAISCPEFCWTSIILKIIKFPFSCVGCFCVSKQVHIALALSWVNWRDARNWHVVARQFHPKFRPPKWHTAQNMRWYHTLELNRWMLCTLKLLVISSFGTGCTMISAQMLPTICDSAKAKSPSNSCTHCAHNCWQKL